MTLIFENDKIFPTMILAFAYLLLSSYAIRRLIALHKYSGTDMNTRKLFIMTCLLTTVVRFTTFASMTALNYAEFHLQVDSKRVPAKVTGDDELTTDAFFGKATLVLFDLPDFCCISAYVLLILVCAEALLQVRMVILTSRSPYFSSIVKMTYENMTFCCAKQCYQLRSQDIIG